MLNRRFPQFNCLTSRLIYRILKLMKNFPHILLATILISITVGINVTKHYSGGELYSVGLFGEAKSCCETTCSCCSNDSELIQFTTEFLVSSDEIELSSNSFIALDQFVVPFDLSVPKSDLILPLQQLNDKHPPNNLVSIPAIQSFLL